jgi:hypothetical protein
MNIVLTMMTMLYNILLTVSILGILSILGFIGVKKIQKFEQNASDVDIFRSEESKTKARVRSIMKQIKTGEIQLKYFKQEETSSLV